MPPTSRLVRCAPILLALALCISCSSGSGSGISEAAAAPSDSPYPSSMVAIGHSGLTGYDSDSDPDRPGADASDNSWATGMNPKVGSVYQRIVALNPAARDHTYNFAIDGSGVDSLLDQEAEAAGVTPAPELVIIQSIDNDIRCDGSDPKNYGPYRRKLTAVMDALAQDLPGADVFFVSQWADVKAYDRVVMSIDPDHLSGSGPCDTVNDKTGKLDPAREVYLQGLVDHYFGIVSAVCAQYPMCRTDHGAMQRMRVVKRDLAEDLNHLSVAGHRKMAGLVFPVLFR